MYVCTNLDQTDTFMSVAEPRGSPERQPQPLDELFCYFMAFFQILLKSQVGVDIRKLEKA